MHHSRLLPRAETSCAFGLRDDADGEFCWKGNCAAAVDHEGGPAAFIFDYLPLRHKGSRNACAPAGF